MGALPPTFADLLVATKYFTKKSIDPGTPRLKRKNWPVRAGVP
jgi:hypothetical protein